MKQTVLDVRDPAFAFGARALAFLFARLGIGLKLEELVDELHVEELSKLSRGANLRALSSCAFLALSSSSSCSSAAEGESLGVGGVAAVRVAIHLLS